NADAFMRRRVWLTLTVSSRGERMRASGLLHCEVRPLPRTSASAVRPDMNPGPVEKKQGAAQNDKADDPYDPPNPKRFREKAIQAPRLRIFGSESLKPRPLGPPILGSHHNPA